MLYSDTSGNLLNQGGTQNWFTDMADWGNQQFNTMSDWTVTPTKAADGSVSGGQWGSVFGAGQGLWNAYMGMKQYGLAKDALQTSKDQFAKNYAAQRTTTNTMLEDRQRARVASSPNAYESVGTYMDKHRIA